MKRIWIILAIVLFFLVLAVFCVIFFFLKAKNNIYHLETTISITINENDKLLTIADKSADEKIINNKFSFITYSVLTGKYKRFQPGKHYLSSDYTIATLVNTLTKTPVEEIRVTIPEGWRLIQIAEKLDELHIAKKEDFLEIAKEQEGYLFPDTYNFTKNTDPSEILKKMKDNYNFRIKNIGKTIDEKTLIIASLVEREAKLDEDRSKVAAVFYNRLAKNMKLETDSTIQYAKGNWNQISAKDLKTDSLYNTYLHSGLPPTPICNPGLKSIEAAAFPANFSALYFINTPDGKTYFADTKQEHDLNIQKYLR